MADEPKEADAPPAYVPPSAQRVESVNKIRSQLLYGQEAQMWSAVLLILADGLYKFSIVPPPLLDSMVAKVPTPESKLQEDILAGSFLLLYAFFGMAIFLAARVVRDQLAETLYKKHNLPVSKASSAWVYAPVIIIVVIVWYMSVIWTTLSVKKLIGPLLSQAGLSLYLAHVTRQRSDEEGLRELEGKKAE